MVDFDIKGLIARQQRQNALQRLGAFGAGMLQHNPMQPTNFWGSLGNATAAMNAVPRGNPLQTALMGMQLQAAQRQREAQDAQAKREAALRGRVTTMTQPGQSAPPSMGYEIPETTPPAIDQKYAPLLPFMSSQGLEAIVQKNMEPGKQQKSFETIYDKDGNPIGQLDTSTGKVSSHPLTVPYRSPETGQAGVFNLGSGTHYTLRSPKEPAPPPPEVKVPKGDPSTATGASGMAAAVINPVSEFIGGGTVLPTHAEWMAEFKRLRVDTIKSIDATIPGRPTNFTRRLEEALTVNAGGWGTDEGAKRKLESGTRRLDIEIKRMNGLLRRDLAPKTRERYVHDLSVLASLRARMAAALAAWGTSKPADSGMAPGWRVKR